MVGIYTVDRRGIINQSLVYEANFNTGVTPSPVLSIRALSMIGSLFQGQEYNVGEEPTVILYTYTHRHEGTHQKQSAKKDTSYQLY